MTTNTMIEPAEPTRMQSFFPILLPVCQLSVHLQRLGQQVVTLVDLEQVEELLGSKDALLPEQVLSPAERIFFQRFSYMKRRREWLGGRLAAKAALLNWPEQPQSVTGSGQTVKQMQQITILPDEHGRPQVDRTDGNAVETDSLAISITHSSRFAAALAVPGQACGIDLQETSPKLPGLTDRFTSAQELELLADSQPDEITGLTMLWSAKEAVKKSILHDQPSIFSGIRVEQISTVADHCRQFYCAVKGQQPQQVMVYIYSPYILALTRANYHA